MLPQIWGWITLSELAIIAIPIIVSSLITGAAFLLRSSEGDYLRKEAIWKAIEEWVALPITGFSDQRDTLPLAEKPPKLAEAIEKCLKRKYPSVWDSLQKLRQEYFEYKRHGKSFVQYVDGRATIYPDDIIAYDKARCQDLRELHDLLAKKIRSEILGKHSTELKC
jgi:hypothetical protein